MLYVKWILGDSIAYIGMGTILLLLLPDATKHIGVNKIFVVFIATALLI